MKVAVVSRNQIPIYFGLAAIVVVLLILISVQTSRNHIQATEAAKASKDRTILLEEIQHKLFEAESVQRGFVITGLATYKDEYLLYGGELELLLARLKDLRFETAEQSQGATQLAQLIHERIQIMDKTVKVREEEGWDAARTRIQAGLGKAAMDRVRDVTQRMAGAELLLLQRIEEMENEKARRLIWLLIAGTVLNIGLIGAAVYLMQRESDNSMRLVVQLQESTREMTFLNNLNVGLQSCTNEQEAEDLIGHFISHQLPGQSGALYVIKPSRNLLELKVGWGDLLGAGSIMEASECWALRLGSTHEVRRGGVELRCAHMDGVDQSAYLCIPMMAQGESIGILHLRAPVDALQVPGRNLAELLATQIGPALSNLIMRQQLHLQSVRDPLTGMYNRRYLEATMDREQVRAERSKSTLGVMMIDLDLFKQINDTHGHQAGDVALQSFATYLQDSVRGGDIVCRYGGEEFTVVLPGASLEQTRERAERLRAGMSTLRVDIGGRLLPPLTASFGVAALPDRGLTWQAVIRAADAALYQAKHSGRNKVVASEPALGSSPETESA